MINQQAIFTPARQIEEEIQQLHNRIHTLNDQLAEAVKERDSLQTVWNIKRHDLMNEPIYNAHCANTGKSHSGVLSDATFLKYKIFVSDDKVWEVNNDASSGYSFVCTYEEYLEYKQIIQR